MTWGLMLCEDRLPAMNNESKKTLFFIFSNLFPVKHCIYSIHFLFHVPYLLVQCACHRTYPKVVAGFTGQADFSNMAALTKKRIAKHTMKINHVISVGIYSGYA